LDAVSRASGSTIREDADVSGNTLNDEGGMPLVVDVSGSAMTGPLQVLWSEQSGSLAGAGCMGHGASSAAACASGASCDPCAAQQLRGTSAASDSAWTMSQIVVHARSCRRILIIG
jgi:hypothetical protein